MTTVAAQAKHVVVSIMRIIVTTIAVVSRILSTLNVSNGLTYSPPLTSNEDKRCPRCHAPWSMVVVHGHEQCAYCK